MPTGSGSVGFTLTEGGDWRSGNSSQSETGTDRYAALEAFGNIANSTGSTPGHLDFNPAGAPFTDPPPDVTPEQGGGGDGTRTVTQTANGVTMTETLDGAGQVL